MLGSVDVISLFLKSLLLSSILLINRFLAAKSDNNNFHKRLNVAELATTFGVFHHDGVPDYHLIEDVHREHVPQQSNNDGQQPLFRRKRSLKNIRFNAWNSSYLIELEPNHRLLSPHLISVIREGEKNKTFQGLPENFRADCHFHGRVLSHGGVRAAISDCNQLMGIIVHDDHFLVIQTIPERLRPPDKGGGLDQQKYRHVIFKRHASLLGNSHEHANFEQQTTPNSSAVVEDRHHDSRLMEKEEVLEEDAEEPFCDVNNNELGEGKTEFGDAVNHQDDAFAPTFAVPIAFNRQQKGQVGFRKSFASNRLTNEFALLKEASEEEDGEKILFREENSRTKRITKQPIGIGGETSLNSDDSFEQEMNRGALPHFENQKDPSRKPIPRMNQSAGSNYTLPSVASLDSLYIFPQLDAITLEIGLFLDSKLYEHFSREFTHSDPEQHLTDFSLALINNVHVLYQQPSLSPNLDIVIVRFEMWKSQPPALATELHKNGQAQTLLDSFCRHQARINPGTDLTDPGHWDHGVMLTGYDIYHTTSSVAGVAPVGRMCDELFACSLVEGLHLGRSFVLAHEMGHNMGMVHDGVQNQCGRSCCLMSAVNGAGKTTWSTCSVREFNAFLMQLDESGRGNCLRDPAESITSHDHLQDGRLPGQRFTADQQCSYFWGRDFGVEIPNGRAYEDICRILWCGNGGSTISTAHPALEGSWCGGERWCHEGNCEPWRPSLGMPTPTPVDGHWSQWTSSEKQCPIVQCQITGSISLISQLRTCTNPAPNNGGHLCEGASLRGLVCGNPRTSCEGFSRQEFGDRLCTAILNDRMRPDRQLSGLSFSHATQPCKIWCHVRESELIRNKGLYPNGSPCGPGQYCVGGLCLKMACEGHSIVQNPQTDCPTEEELEEALTATEKGKSSTAGTKWTPWSPWSECSTTCGEHGIQRRWRKCRAPDVECQGKATEMRSCEPTPPRCVVDEERYTDWRPWSQCSVSCGGNGTRRRDRDCLTVGHCELPLVEFQPCEAPQKCPEWLDWAPWSECSASCGGGHRLRQRKCSVESACGEGEAEQVEQCNQDPCTTTESTTTTTTTKEPISTTTSHATTEESHLVSTEVVKAHDISETSLTTTTPSEEDQVTDNTVEGSGEEFDEVEGKNLPEGEWSNWRPCSVSCGIGFQVRERYCGPKDTKTGRRRPCSEGGKQARTCHAGDCSLVKDNIVRSEWSLWSACSKTCGEGIQRRSRKCLNNVCSSKSTEEQQLIEHKRCVLGPCPSWSPWSQWSECGSCSIFETRKRTRKCVVRIDNGIDGALDGAQKKPEITEVGRELCEGAPVEFDTCGRSCPLTDGGGKHEQQSSFSEENSTAATLSVILLSPGTTPPASSSSSAEQGDPYGWHPWSPCSTSCGKGTRQRMRVCHPTEDCAKSGGLIREIDQCSVAECENGMSFSETSTSTSTTTKVDGIIKNFLMSRGWNEWSAWSPCSKTCGRGTQYRNRSCRARFVFLCGDGYSREERDCNNHPCPALDSVDFDTVESDLQNDDEKSVLEKFGPKWSEWSEWSACSCFSLKRYRRRYCQIRDPSLKGFCTGPILEQEHCEPTDCRSVSGGWSSWGPWSRCSQRCGTEADGHRIRNRMCANPPPSNRGSYCVGYSFDQIPCTPRESCASSPVIDGQWTDWLPWSNCSNHCLNGQRSRTRFCAKPRAKNGGRPCVGNDFELQSCGDPSKCETSSITNTTDAINNTSTETSHQIDNPSASSTASKIPHPATMNEDRSLPSSTADHFPVGGWSSWSPWSKECSSPCGFGYRHRQRFCHSPPPDDRIGRRPCSGLAWATALCTALPPSNSTESLDFAKIVPMESPESAEEDLRIRIDSIDGRWSEWSDWSSTCGWPCLHPDTLESELKTVTDDPQGDNDAEPTPKKSHFDKNGALLARTRVRQCLYERPTSSSQSSSILRSPPDQNQSNGSVTIPSTRSRRNGPQSLVFGGRPCFGRSFELSSCPPSPPLKRPSDSCVQLVRTMELVDTETNHPILVT